MLGRKTEQIIGVLDILVPPSSEEFEDVYIVSELMETDLHRIINTRQELTPDHVQYFLYQVSFAANSRTWKLPMRYIWGIC